jgi:predicted ribosome quality control (RQC) complex YloA/Tae2 family protein
MCLCLLRKSLEPIPRSGHHDCIKIIDLKSIKYVCLVISLVGLLPLPLRVLAQECRVESASQNSYLVKINNKQLIAVPATEIDELQRLRKKVDQQKSEIEDLKQENNVLRDKGNLLSKYITKYKEQAEATLAAKDNEINLLTKKSELMEKDRDLASTQINKLKACCLITPDRKISFQAGIGVTGRDSDAAVLVGAGYGQWRIFGFMQDSNSGLLLGYQF